MHSTVCSSSSWNTPYLFPDSMLFHSTRIPTLFSPCPCAWERDGGGRKSLNDSNCFIIKQTKNNSYDSLIYCLLAEQRFHSGFSCSIIGWDVIGWVLHLYWSPAVVNFQELAACLSPNWQCFSSIQGFLVVGTLTRLYQIPTQRCHRFPSKL